MDILLPCPLPVASGYWMQRRSRPSAPMLVHIATGLGFFNFYFLASSYFASSYRGISCFHASTTSGGIAKCIIPLSLALVKPPTHTHTPPPPPPLFPPSSLKSSLNDEMHSWGRTRVTNREPQKTITTKRRRIRSTARAAGYHEIWFYWTWVIIIRRTR